MLFQTVLKKLRTERNLSQQALSEELEISQSAIAKWELGKTEPTASYIVKISKYFNVKTDYLLGLIDEFDNEIK